MRRYMLPIILLLSDILSLCISVWLAAAVRFAGTEISVQKYVSVLAMSMPLYIICHIFFYIFRLYSRIWKYAGIKEMFAIAGSNLCGTALFVLVRFAMGARMGNAVPRSIVVLACFFNIALIAASRLFKRWAEKAMPSICEISVNGW